MRIKSDCFKSMVFFALAFLAVHTYSQNNKKYQSLFWEISGNGLQKPSYLYGSMHVSNKIVFHLSDPFFVALKNCDMIALEENPENFVKIYEYYNELGSDMDQDFSNFTYNNYGSSDGFYGDAFELIPPTRNKIIHYLQVDNQYINQLLYRYESYYNGNEEGDYSDNFAESTYLDLFIFQAARKNGKPVINLENFKTTLDLQIKSLLPDEDKKKYSYNDYQYLGQNNIQNLVEDAYLRGDLDLLDSLLTKMNPSKNFKKYFINERNRLMSVKMDSIMKSGTSLFTTIGSAHLPGSEGVIELLRSKGYTVNPISKYLINKKSSELKKIEVKKVKLAYSAWQPSDSTFEVTTPGSLTLMHNTNQNRFYIYTDMANGAFYFISRIPTFQFLTHHTVDYVLSQIDSALYQGIPGEILSKKDIEKNGVKGFDIQNKTKRGDYQRYQIFVTPLEILIFKMGAASEYVKEESDIFFNSIRFNTGNLIKNVGSNEKGFKIRMKDGYTQSETVLKGYGKTRRDQIVQTVDSLNYYLMMRSSYHDYNYIEDDSFELAMLAHNFLKERGYKVVDSIPEYYQGKPSLFLRSKNDSGEYLNLKITINGPFYYLLVSTNQNTQATASFMNSLNVGMNEYINWSRFSDTTMHFSAELPEMSIPKGADYKNMLKNIYSNFSGNDKNKSYQSMEMEKTFRYGPSDESIKVVFYRYNKYANFKNPEELWNKILLGTNNKPAINSYLESLLYKNNSYWFSSKEKPDFNIVHKTNYSNGVNKIFEYTMTDSISTRGIRVKHILRNGALYSLYNCIDTTQGMTEFSKRFFETFSPDDTLIGTDVFADKTKMFFANLNGEDTTLVREALESIRMIEFVAHDTPELLKTIKTFNFKKWGSNYKIDLIEACATLNSDSVFTLLKEVFESAGDTSSLKFAALNTLASIKTSKSYGIITSLLEGDIPFDNNSDGIDDFFIAVSDSLGLAKVLFPTLLNLTRYEEYRDPVYELLSDLADSNMIKPEVYKSHLNIILSDANNQLKRTISEENDFNESSYDDYGYGHNNYIDDDLNKDLYTYASILLPFIAEPRIKTFIDKTLSTHNEKLKLCLSVLLMKNNQVVPDTVWEHFGKSEVFSTDLYKSLKSVGRIDKFPKANIDQKFFARALLISASYSHNTDTVVYLCKKLATDGVKSGYLYFFKYKDKDNDDKEWNLAYCGIQPGDTNNVDASYPDYHKFSNESIPTEPSKLEKKLNDIIRTIGLSNRKRAGNSNDYNYDY